MSRDAFEGVEERHVEFGLLGDGGENFRDGEGLAEVVD